MFEQVTPRQGAHPGFFTERGELTLRIHIINFSLKSYVVKITP